MWKPKGMGGGRMLRAVGRAVEARVSGGDVLNGAASSESAGQGSAKPARGIHVSSSSGLTSAPASPTLPAAGWGSHPWSGDVEEWERVGGEEDLGDAGEIDFEVGLIEQLLEMVPTKEEVEGVVCTLQQLVVPVGSAALVEDTVDKEIVSVDELKRGSSGGFSAESDPDWIEPEMQLYSSNYFHREKVYDAFRLLKMNPSIQRMVVSISSDKAVWDAVMKNEVVLELKKSLYEDFAVRNNEELDADDPPEIAPGILSWILDNTKAKVKEFIDQIMKLLHDIFRTQEKDEKNNALNDALRSSFMLSVMVFVVVVVTRVRSA